MEGSRLTKWQQTVARKAADLLKRDSFVDELRQLEAAPDDAVSLFGFLKLYDLPVEVMPMFWHFLTTGGEVEASKVAPPFIRVINEQKNTVDGWPTEMIFPASRPPAVKLELHPWASKEQTIEFIRSHWDSDIQPALNGIRGRPRGRVDSEYSLKRKLQITEMRQTMKPAQIAIQLGMTAKQVSEILYLERKKFRTGR